jgi:hypothetical protein
MLGGNFLQDDHMLRRLTRVYSNTSSTPPSWQSPSVLYLGLRFHAQVIDDTEIRYATTVITYSGHDALRSISSCQSATV